jgi:hypothetical protein
MALFLFMAARMAQESMCIFMGVAISLTPALGW